MEATDGRNSTNKGGGGREQNEEEAAVTNIKVAVRCRPMSKSELVKAEKSCFRIENGTACLENPANPGEVHR